MPSSSSSLTVVALESALDTLLSSNFDADSKEAFATYTKLLDNIISKPADDRVRTLKLDNKVLQQKIVAKKGGLDFLLACGFEVIADSALLSQISENRLVLANEDTQHLLTARRLLHTRAVRDLQIDPNQLPPIKQPPSVMPTTSIYTQNSGDSGRCNFSFNPYAGHRFDAKAHAAGVPSIKPDADYKSPVESKLLQLQRRKEQLEQASRMQPPARNWMALYPGQDMPKTTDNELIGNSYTTESSSDSSLIALHLQKQQHAAQERERFTTRAMREIKVLERERVYSHATLTIQFNNGMRLIGKFLPFETVEAVKDAMIKECFVATDTPSLDVDGDVAMDGASPFAQFDLFVTPPRRILDNSRTLEQEGLVPAAKIFCTAVQGIAPRLFGVNNVAFPVGQAVTGSTATDGAGTTALSKKDLGENDEQKLVSREEALLQRMMGKVAGKGNGKMSSDKDKSAANKKPKWFG